MAEQLQIRQIKLDDGTTLSFDGTNLVIDGAEGNPTRSAVIPLDTRVDQDALVWLIQGRAPRRTSGAAKRAKPAKPSGGTAEPPAGAVPGA